MDAFYIFLLEINIKDSSIETRSVRFVVQENFHKLQNNLCVGHWVMWRVSAPRQPQVAGKRNFY